MGGNDALRTNLGVSAALHLLTAGFTSFRLRHRYRIRQIWWDDWWIGFGLLCSLVHMTEPMWYAFDQGERARNKSRAILAFWISSVSFALGTWSARISLSTSIARFTLQERGARRLLFIMGASFSLTCLALLFSQVVMCIKYPGWQENPLPSTSYHHSFILVLNVLANISGDACLVLAPLCMLFRLNLSRKQRRLIAYVLVASLLSLAVGIVYVVFVVKAWQGSLWEGWRAFVDLLSHLKLSTTVLVSNLPSMIIYIKNLWGTHEDGSEVFESEMTKRKSRARRLSSCSTRYSASLVLTEISEDCGGCDSRSLSIMERTRSCPSSMAQTNGDRSSVFDDCNSLATII